MEKTQRVAAAVIRRAGSVLICRRPSHKRHGGLWEFPGGKLKNGESIRDGIVRELSEELAVEVIDLKEPEFSIKDEGSEFVIEFVPVEIKGDPQCIEHTAIAWVAREMLKDYQLAPSDARYAEQVLIPNIDA